MSAAPGSAVVLTYPLDEGPDPRYGISCPMGHDGHAARVDCHGERVSIRCMAACDDVEVRAGFAPLHDGVLAELKARKASIIPSSGSPDPELSGAPRLRVVSAADVKIERVDYLIDERAARGAATILAGDPGLGKSSLTMRWAADVSQGRHGGPPANMLIANGEDSRSVSAARLKAADADMSRVFFFNVEDEHGERGAVLPNDVPLIEARALEIGNVALVVIDPLNAHLADGTNAHRDHSIRRAIAPASAMAERLNVALLFVAHLNKAMGGEALYRIGGSIGLVGGVRSVLLFTADPDDPDGDEGSQRCLGHIKSNWGKLAPTLVYRHVPIVLDEVGERIETHTLREVGESDVAGGALLGIDPDDPPATKRERATELLADVLAGKGWTRASEVEAHATAQGIGRRTLYAAADDVGVEREKRGFPAITFWRVDSRADQSCTTDVQPGPHGNANPVAERKTGAPDPQECKPTGDAQQAHLRAVPDATNPHYDPWEGSA